MRAADREPPGVHIRKECAADVAAIRMVIEQAFRDAPHSDQREPFIVEALRDSRALSVSQVAETNGRVIGHVAISPVTISDGSRGWFGLGPIAVLPTFQRQGVGSSLLSRALTDLEAKRAAGCVVLGDPGFYGRFGFEVVDGLVYAGVPAEYFQARSFDGAVPQGEVAYHEAFSANG